MTPEQRATRRAELIAELIAERERLRQAKRERLEAERDAIIARHPLAHARLWRPHCPSCDVPMQCPADLSAQHECPECGEVEARTCQRCAIDAAMQPGIRVAFVLGGNRSGKSAGAAQLDAAFALGGQHPDVVEWLKANRLPTTRIPERPGAVVSTALTSGDSRAYVRPKVKAFLPPDWRWLGEFSTAPAIAYAPDSNPAGYGGVIHFKTVDQGRRGHQGSDVDLYRFDEEPDDLQVVTEARRGLIDRCGLAVFSMTPLKGWTPLLSQFVEKPDEDVVVRYLAATDNPYVSAEEVRAILRKATAAQRDARIRGKIAPLEGAVHPDFDRAVHVIPARPLPEDWPRFRGIDFGTRDPFVCLWAALGPDDTLHIYREHYRAEATLQTHASAIYDAEHCPDCEPMPRYGGDDSPWWRWVMSCADGTNTCASCDGSGRTEPHPEATWADPANLDSRTTLNGEYGLATSIATKDRAVTLEALVDRLSLDVEGRPHILFHDCCVETIREVENLVWNERSKRELETKGADHAWDVLRYICRGLQLSGYSRAANTANEDTNG